jgi:class 3 adenylate cyclase
VNGHPHARDRLARIAGGVRAVNSSETVARAARALRRVAPGADPLVEGWPSTSRTSDRIARLIVEAGADRPNAARELGIAGVQMWRALIRRKDLRRDGAELVIVFTDLVGFSSWALRVGDDQVLRLLREVTRVSEEAVGRHGGKVVKSLGDGLMAVFTDTAAAIGACHEMCTTVSALEIDGYRPQLRTGLHSGAPRLVRGDYIGVDVNVAARVAAAASGGEVLVSGPALAKVDSQRYTTRRRRRFRAKGTPADLEVYSVVPRHDPPSSPS